MHLKLNMYNYYNYINNSKTKKVQIHGKKKYIWINKKKKNSKKLFSLLCINF